jgi:hypothetical protein
MRGEINWDKFHEERTKVKNGLVARYNASLLADMDDWDYTIDIQEKLKTNKIFLFEIDWIDDIYQKDDKIFMQVSGSNPEFTAIFETNMDDMNLIIEGCGFVCYSNIIVEVSFVSKERNPDYYPDTDEPRNRFVFEGKILEVGNVTEMEGLENDTGM